MAECRYHFILCRIACSTGINFQSVLFIVCFLHHETLVPDMTGCRYFLLCNQNLPTYRAVFSLCTSRLRAGGGYGRLYSLLMRHVTEIIFGIRDQISLLIKCIIHPVDPGSLIFRIPAGGISVPPALAGLSPASFIGVSPFPVFRQIISLDPLIRSHISVVLKIIGSPVDLHPFTLRHPTGRIAECPPCTVLLPCTFMLVDPLSFLVQPVSVDPFFPGCSSCLVKIGIYSVDPVPPIL